MDRRQSPAYLRLGALLTVIVMALAGVGTSAADYQYTDDGIIVIPYGVNDQIESNPYFDDSYLTEDCLSFSSCTVAPTPLGRAIARLTADSGETWLGSAGVGLRYQLSRACHNQNLSAGFVVEYDFTPTITNTFQGEGTATNSIESRASSNDDVAVPISVLEGRQEWTTANIAAFLNHTYETSLAARSSAAASPDTGAGANEVTAETQVDLHSINFVFGDELGPGQTVTTSPAKGDGGNTGDFLGWYNTTDPVITIDANELYLINGDSVAGSCVDRVQVDRELDGSRTNWTTLYPGWYQEDVTTTASAEHRYKFHITSWDRAGNPSESDIVEFGIDHTGPVTGWSIPAVTGNDGWYKKHTTLPRYTLTCDDTNGALTGDKVSGCDRIRYKWLGRSQVEQQLTSLTTTEAPEGAEVTIASNSSDIAKNRGGDPAIPAIKYDKSLPTPGARTSIPHGFSLDWFNDSLQLDTSCTDQTQLSGCRETRLRCNSEAFVPAEPRDFTQEGWNTCVIQVEDKAGNWNNLTKKVNLDFQDPAHVLVDTTVPYTTMVGNNYIREYPKFTWNEPDDPGPANITRYEIYFDGALRTNPASNRTYWPSQAELTQGGHCVQVVAVDEAGNRDTDDGSDPGEFCFFYDTLLPGVVWTVPLSGKLYADGRVLDLAPGVNTIVIGKVHTWVTADDALEPASSSEVYKIEIWDDFNPVTPGMEERREPCTDPPTVISSCDWNDNEGVGIALGEPKTRNLLGRATDRAGNVGESSNHYVRMQLVVYENQSTDVPHGDVFWALYDDVQETKIEVLGKVGETGVWETLDTVNDMNVRSYVDARIKDATVPYYYALRIYDSVNLVHYTNVVEKWYNDATDHGTVSDWLGCTPLTC